MIITGFSMVVLTAPAQATSSDIITAPTQASSSDIITAPLLNTVNAVEGNLQLADWWWDTDDRYGFDRCNCPAWRERILQDCDNVCVKYRDACFAYKARKNPCNCGFFSG
jgi:hypothetical protein